MVVHKQVTIAGHQSPLRADLVAQQCGKLVIQFCGGAPSPDVAQEIDNGLFSNRKLIILEIRSGAYAAAFPVTKSGAGYCVCQNDHKDLVSFDEKPLSEPETELGGLSGGCRSSLRCAGFLSENG
jgi:hypothetical protein